MHLPDDVALTTSGHHGTELALVSAHPPAPSGIEHAEAGAGAMLVACRLAGLSALEA